MDITDLDLSEFLEKEYDIHYWHGKECTADEMGSSAAFTV